MCTHKDRKIYHRLKYIYIHIYKYRSLILVVDLDGLELCRLDLFIYSMPCIPVYTRVYPCIPMYTRVYYCDSIMYNIVIIQCLYYSAYVRSIEVTTLYALETWLRNLKFTENGMTHIYKI